MTAALLTPGHSVFCFMHSWKDVYPLIHHRHALVQELLEEEVELHTGLPGVNGFGPGSVMTMGTGIAPKELVGRGQR